MQVQTDLSYEVVRPLILIRMVSFLLKIFIFYIFGHRNWLNQPFFAKIMADFLGFASPDRFIVCDKLCFETVELWNVMHARGIVDLRLQC